MTKKKVETEFVTISLDSLEPNTGQLEGLPANPRQITETKLSLLKENIKQYPEMLNLRGLMVYPFENDKYIIIGGNMRYRALKELNYKDAPCVIIPKNTDIEKLKAYTIIDNNGFGKYDWDMLANEWDEYQLEEWGVDLPVIESDIDVDDFFDSLGENKEKDGKDRIVVEIPNELLDKKEDIRQSLLITLEVFKGVTIK